jgi:hypothetical protein
MKSWKTSLFGLIASLSVWAASATNVPHWLNLAGELSLSLGIAGVGIQARDKNVSSEQQGIKPAVEPVK